MYPVALPPRLPSMAHSKSTSQIHWSPNARRRRAASINEILSPTYSAICWCSWKTTVAKQPMPWIWESLVVKPNATPSVIVKRDSFPRPICLFRYRCFGS